MNLEVLDRRDGSVRPVTHGERRHVSPTWSPDGHYLAFLDVPLRFPKLVKDEKPTSIVRVDVEHLDRKPHVLVVGKTEEIRISWQPSPGDRPNSGGFGFPKG